MTRLSSVRWQFVHVRACRRRADDADQSASSSRDAIRRFTMRGGSGA
jgi:hypothetical protein